MFRIGFNVLPHCCVLPHTGQLCGMLELVKSIVPPSQVGQDAVSKSRNDILNAESVTGVVVPAAKNLILKFVLLFSPSWSTELIFVDAPPWNEFEFGTKYPSVACPLFIQYWLS